MCLAAAISTALLGAAFIASSSSSIAQRPASPAFEPTATPTPVVVESKATNSDGRSAEIRFLSTSGITHFITRANELASEGYRLEYVSHEPSVRALGELPSAESFNHFRISAIFRHTPDHEFEYTWFEAHDPGELTTRIEIRADKGFRVRKSIRFYNDFGCNKETSRSSDDQLGALLGTLISYWCGKTGDIFIMERHVGSPEKYDYKVLAGVWGWGKSPTTELESELTPATEKGFYPVVLGRAKVNLKEGTYVLAERAKNAEVGNTPQEFKYLKSEYGFFKKLNRAAAEGYRINQIGMLGAFRHALLVKSGNPDNVVYVPLEGGTKKDRAAIPLAINQNLEYLRENREALDLVAVKRTTQRFDYKLLRMLPEFPKRTKSNPDPKPLKSQAEILREFDSFLESGYAVRDLIYLDGPVALFSRAIK